MALIEGGEARGFDAARVVRDAFSVLRRYGLPFAAMGLLCYGAPQLLMGWGDLRMANADGAAAGFAFAATAIGFLGMIVGGTVAQIAYTAVVVGYLTDRPVTMRTALDVGVQLFWPGLVLNILAALGIGMATLVLIVPGLYVATMWSVAMPALVMERFKHEAALARSAALTSGHRWPVFGLMMAVIVGYIGLVAACGWMVGGDGAFDDRSLAGLAVSMLSSVLGSLLLAVAGAVLYVELRRLEESGGDQPTASPE